MPRPSPPAQIASSSPALVVSTLWQSNLNKVSSEGLFSPRIAEAESSGIRPLTSSFSSIKYLIAVADASSSVTAISLYPGPCLLTVTTSAFSTFLIYSRAKMLLGLLTSSPASSPMKFLIASSLALG